MTAAAALFSFRESLVRKHMHNAVGIAPVLLSLVLAGTGCCLRPPGVGPSPSVPRVTAAELRAAVRDGSFNEKYAGRVVELEGHATYYGQLPAFRGDRQAWFASV